jgi:hypothetical protein
LKDAVIISDSFFLAFIVSIESPEYLVDCLYFGHSEFLFEFVGHGLVPVFDHVFGSGVVEEGDDASPMCSMLFDLLKQYFVFFVAPVASFYVVV